MSQASLTAIVPAAGVGSRMKADRPKQYLLIDNKTVLEHTIEKLLSHPLIEQVVVSITDGDPYFESLEIANHPKVIRVSGGKERADSVLSGLNWVNQTQDEAWVLVHDAARPCVDLADITSLIESCMPHSIGGILATPVRDTMKRAREDQSISRTEDREGMWHALTPQLFKAAMLGEALKKALELGVSITDEASALEWIGEHPKLITGKASNIKITQPEDLALAEFYLSREKE